MGNLLNFAVYNPAILSDEDFLAGFVARRELAEKLINRLREVTLDNVAQHRLIIGQRGMGKTSMLRRISLGIREDPELSKVLLPLNFREEQYNVHNLHVFWSNCLDALGDLFEKEGNRNLASQVDRDVVMLSRKVDDLDGALALEVFKGWCSKVGKRPLLLIDNIDLIFDGLAKQDWTLRRILQEPGGIVVIGATCSFLEATAKIEAPFYDFFQIELLEKVTYTEMITCLRSLARERGAQGRKVLHLLDGDPARIQSLYDLTGGNPRTLVLLYLLLEMDTDGDVMGDLERLLDQVTVLYKARVEDLPPQSRVVLDAVALNWNPITVSSISETTGIEATSVSSQLDRLQKLGIVEKVTLSTPAPTGYQLGERFFNIWYLMRNASRRLRNRLRWLTEFLRRLYSPQQLSSMACDFMRSPSGDGHSAGMYCLALADAVGDSSLRHALHHFATSQLDDYSQEIRTKLEEIVDLSDLDKTTLEMKELKRRVLNCQRNWGSSSAEEFWNLLGGSVSISKGEKQRIISDLPSLPVDEINRIVSIYKDGEAKINKSIGLTGIFDELRTALREGIINEPGDLNHAQAAANYFGSDEILAVIIHFVDENKINSLDKCKLNEISDALSNLFNESKKELNSLCYYKYGWFLVYSSRFDDAEAAYRQSIEKDKNNYRPWSSLGYVLHKHLGRFEEAEFAYRRAIELNPKLSNPWNNLGILLRDNLRRYEDAEVAFRKSIEIIPKKVIFWNNLGNLLKNQFKRYSEAEIIYRQAIEIDPKAAYIWCNLGDLYQCCLEKFEEAEAAYRKAIEIDSEYSRPWDNLGDLLQHRVMRYEEAEAAYKKAIEIDPANAFPWNSLGWLFQEHFDRYEEAETAYRKAIEINPKIDEPWNGLGWLLQERFGRYEEAEAAYRKAIDIDPENAATWNNLGDLLHDHLGRYKDANEAYRRSVELSPRDIRSWTSFGNLLYDHLGDKEQAEIAYKHEFDLSPDEIAPKVNLAYLLMSDPNRSSEAELYYEEAVKCLPVHGHSLLTAFRAFAHDNFGEAIKAFAIALETDHPELFTVFYPGLMRVLRIAKERDYGEKLLQFMDESGLGERYWPLYAAFTAYMFGEEKLRDVNPEVRRAAKRIYDWLASNQKDGTVEEKTGKKGVRKTGRKQTK